MVFASSSRQFHHDMTTLILLSGPGQSKQFHRDMSVPSISRDWQKPYQTFIR
jgi:hypothetical protein